MSFSLPAELLEATRLTNAGQITKATASLQRMLGTGLPVTRIAGPGRHAAPNIYGVVDSQEMILPAPADKHTFSDGMEDSAFRIKNKLINPALADPWRGFIDEIRHRGLPRGLGHRAPSPIPVSYTHLTLPTNREV